MGRRIKIFKPDTPFFDISAPVTLSGEPLKQSKIAAGMEVYFTVTFKPQEVREYAWDLICCTERENFIVPLRAVGLRPLLNLPDEIDFGPCPIKSATEKKIVVQNTGTAVAKFTMTSSNTELLCPEQDISIEAGASYQLSLSFMPTSTMDVDGEVAVLFNNGVKCFIAVKGYGKNVEVSLSTPSVTVEPSYISLFSQKTLRIRNASDAPIRYRWKSFATEEEEEAERERLLVEINRIEEEERATWQERLMSGAYDNMDGGDYDEEELEELQDEEMQQHLPFRARVDDAIITRKYRNLRKALEMDKMLFVDDIFEISPIEGEVWAFSDMEITVCFRPDTAAQYNCLAFLDVSGRHDRLSLQLMGQGIGPHAALSFEVLDIGDVFVNDVNNYELTIKNKGDIPAQWTFMSSLTRFGNKFQFSPTDGYLLPNQAQQISIRFESDILGEFSEYFRFALQGNEDMLVCQIKGQVIGPTFHFDCNSIDFGTVSFDYLHSTTVRLVNTSKVPMTYHLHIPQDGTYLKKEFNLEPARGTLAPKESTEVLVEFIPTTVKTYDYSLAVDVLGVGDVLLSIPITAECIISAIKVDLPSRELEFGNVFLRYPYELDLKLINLSTIVHTKFEISEQPKHTRSVCSYETSPSVAVIEPGDVITVKVRLIGQKLGSYKVPVTINIAGSQEPPMQAVLSFNTVGPRVVVGSTELKWGNIECLKDSTRALTLENTGLINANLKLFLKMARSCYRLEVRELVLEAQQSYDLQITANLDDSVVTKDEVHIMVDEGDNLMVPLVAKGIGTTMYCKTPIEVLDLGTQLTNVYFERQIVLENKGRRPQQLRWTNKTNKLENAARITKAKKMGKDLTRLPKNLLPQDAAFTVTPMEITLRSRTATTFTFKGFSNVPRLLSEVFVLESKVGKERNLKQIMETEVRCDVVNPLLTFSTDALSFLYVWERDVDAAIQRKCITLTNSSSITLTFVLKAEIPFNLNTYEQTLEPGEDCEVAVEFDPTYKDDKQSHVVDQTIQIQYRGHPQKDSIRVQAEMVYPNLKFDVSSINFGCILNDTSKTIRVHLTNTCKIDVKYEWIFLEQGANNGGAGGNAGGRGKQRGAVFSTPPSNIFDILPVTSVIQPQRSEDIEFTMLSTSNMKIQGTVVCVVEGGPEYRFHIHGESSNVGYELDRSVLDFGKVLFTERADQEVIITNTGRVSFPFQLFASSSEDAAYLEFLPASGKVAAGHTAKVIVRMRPGLPTLIKCAFTAQIAHFDPVQIDCYCQGIFPAAFVSLPRQKKVGPCGELENVTQEMWESFQALAITNLLHPDTSLMAPAVPPPAASDSTLAPPGYRPALPLPPFPPHDGEDLNEMLMQSSIAAPAASLASSTRGVNPMQLDVEMQRLAMNHIVENKLKSLAEQKLLDDEPSALMQDIVSKYVALKDVVVGRYVCDFGHVIMGQTKKKIFKISNASLSSQLNWIFDKKYLGASGFSIEPEKVVKLLEGGSVDFTVKFFARTNQKPGIKTMILPLEMLGAPSLHIVLTANVCLPEIELSSTSIDVGKVVLGRSAKVFVGLKNVSPVSASWMLRRGGKDELRFTCEPSMGTLRPGKKAIVAIEFLPTDAKKCVADFLLKVDQNRKHKSIHVAAEGLGTPLIFDAPAVDIRPVIPGSEGGEQIVTVTNTSDFAVEFFSVDFDSQYKDEEATLSAIETSYDVAGLIRSEIRQPGARLPKSVQEAFEAFKSASASAAAAPEPAREGSETVAAEEAPAAAAVAVELLKPVLRVKEGFRDKGLHQDIVVVGPPLGGVSSLVQSLSKKLYLPVRSFDQMLLDVAAAECVEGEMARVLCDRSTPEELAARKAKEQELFEAAEKSKAEAADAFKKDKKNSKVKEVPEEVYQTAEVAALRDYQHIFDKTAANVAQVLTARLRWEDFGDGAIFEDIVSRFVSTETLVAALQISLPKAIFAAVSIEQGAEGFTQWIEHLYTQKVALLERLRRSMELNKRALIKTLRPMKGKTMDDQVRELEAAYASAEVPEAIPSGDESWIDQISGDVIELESNDFKALDEKEKPLYLRQSLYAQHVQVKEAESSLKKIERYRKRILSDDVATAGETAAAAEEVVDAPSAGETEAEGKVDGEVAEEEAPLRTYEWYIQNIVPVLSGIRRGVLKAPVEESASSPVAEGEGGEEEKKEEEKKEEAGDKATEEQPAKEDGAEEAVVKEEEVEEGGLFEILLSGDESIEAVLQLALSQLPAPKVSSADKENALPETEVYQIYRKPLNRPHRRAIRHFKLVDLSDELIKPKVVEAPVVPEPVVDPKAAKGKPAKGKAAAPVEVPPVVEIVEVKPPPPAPTRWIVPAQSSVQLKVRFVCDKEGSFETQMDFEVVGSGQKIALPCKCICEYPKINVDTRNLFLRRLKALNPANPYPIKRFVIAENLYSFGALALFKKADWKKTLSDTSSDEDREKFASIEQTHSDVVRITNNGKYTCDVTLTVEYEEGSPADIFHVEPNVVQVEEGETKEVRLWALPKEVRDYQGTLAITVARNPTVTRFPLKCAGADATVDLLGPWTEALSKAEEALAANTDKKAAKQLEANVAALKEAFLVDFDRVLLSKQETRPFKIKNTCTIPVAFEVLPEDFLDSPNISFSPASGVVGYGESLELQITFTSPEALMLSGKFSLKYADNEGGLQTSRAIVRKFRVQAEAYAITAVTLSSSGSEMRGTSELDFGLVRVGDYAVQTLKIGNKGKYKIGYSFHMQTPGIANLLKLEPMEGTIEPQPAESAAPAKGKAAAAVDPTSGFAEVKVTFCSREGEMLLKSNAEILVYITEPLTGEIVEKFPLLITAQAKYNRFRLQPAKGISFGAIRFDADPRVKRAELRNESAFEVTYVIMPAIAEHDEIDDLDAAAYAAYAVAVPAALRSKELGDNYLNRIGGGGGGAAGGKKEAAKAPAKGKAGAGVAVEVAASTLNPLVKDPDSLTLGALPTDPLVVGAFTVHPRIATVQPGQSVSIDMKFDPSGCETVKEKLRICVSGADPKDPLSQTVRAFEVAGESCLPALVTDDMLSIFEEQEVVSSLAESMGDQGSNSKGENSVGKLEKLPVGKVVYAESERMLAFGPVACNQSGKGTVERIKISNPTKIDIKVKFKVLTSEAFAQLSSSAANAGAAANAKGAPPKKDAGKDKGKKGDKAGADTAVSDASSMAFAVQPEVWEIPPHEHRFVNVYFNPTEIKSYRSVFLAEIDDEGVSTSAAPKTVSAGKSLSFGLGGSGTLPCIAIEQPTDRDSAGNVLVPFGKVLVEKVAKRSLTIRNDGVMSATCLFELISGDISSPTSDYVFAAHGTSLTIAPGAKAELPIKFAPRSVVGNGDRSASIKISVLNNAFGVYFVKLSGNAYACDAMFDAKPSSSAAQGEEMEEEDDPDAAAVSSSDSDKVVFPDINLSANQTQSQTTILLRSRANHNLRFELSVQSDAVPADTISFAPSLGHLGPFGTREITLTFKTDKPLTVDNVNVQCLLRKLDYRLTSEDPAVRHAEESLWGRWDDAMKSIRPAYPEDLKAIQDYATALKDYQLKVEAEQKKGKKGKPVGPPPEKCMLQLAPVAEDGQQMVYEIVSEPFHELDGSYASQQLAISCSGVADAAAIDCEGNGDTLKFLPTYLFQSAVHRFRFKNNAKIQTPVRWVFENLNSKKRMSRPQSSTAISRAGTASLQAQNPRDREAPNPFSIEPMDLSVVSAQSSKEFTLKFAPTDAGEYLYALRGYTFSDATSLSNSSSNSRASRPGTSNHIAGDSKAAINMVIYGLGKRPVCHFEIEETPDYLSRRPPNLKNEQGLFSSIESTDLKIVEVESVGLKTRNTFRFYVTNTTNESYEFLWGPLGEASAFWRCVQGAGMMFPGKRIEMLFEYLPEDIHVAEAFFQFSLPKVGLSQVFLFTGKVAEPKVSFSAAKLDFHAVMLGGEGITETVYLENTEHLPFNFAFDKYSLMQLEGPDGPVLSITPSEGSVPPNGRIPVTFYFKPQEEVVYSYNVICNVKRKPNKLAINVKGEGYAVHPQIQLEQTVVDIAPSTTIAAAANDTTSGKKDKESAAKSSTTTLAPAANKPMEKFITLKPLPHVNIADFGSVQVLDSLAKTLTVLNAGKYNFDYSWNIEHLGSMLSLSGGKLNGTLLKGDELSYKITFAPQSEGNLDQCQLRFTVAGKYVYQIVPRGLAVKPALRFSFMHHNFGPCFVTSPGGTTVVEEQILTLKNHDPASNITVECVFQKIRALAVECPPAVIPPGGELLVPLRFAPREVKDYSFAVPFMVNGTSRVQVQVVGTGILAKLELVNGAQRRTAFGLVNVGTSANRSVLVANKSKKALPLKLVEGGEYGTALSDRCISFAPTKEVILAPRETLAIALDFKPTKRVNQFSEDLLVQYAGVSRSLVTLSGRAQGIECALDTDSIPFGLVVLDSQKVKKVTLENTGDLTITFQWQESSFGPHFRITPLAGKVLPGNEMVFDVVFKPQFVDEDIRQDQMTLLVPGQAPMSITCSGVCIVPPTENIQTLTFASMARKNDVKLVKITNPTDKDWFLSPSLQGQDWKVPYEFKVPAKNSADLPVTYYPLTMTSADVKHTGKLFVALPDGSAQLYDLHGSASAPECSGKVEVETPAKKAATVVLKVSNWLSEVQRLNVTTEILSQPSPATFVIAANATEVGPNGTKEFPVRFVAFCEGTSKARITFTNPATGEYCFYELTAKTTMSEVLEVFTLEAPVRQTARTIISIENPLPLDVSVNMGSVAKPVEWWTCDNTRSVKVNELIGLSGQREGSFEVEYRPLTVTSRPQEHLLTIVTQELGTFKYKLIVKASPPLLKQTLRFDAALGTMQTEYFVFRSYHASAPNASAYTFQCSVQSNPDCFSLAKVLPIDAAALATTNAWAGEEIRCAIQFEPVSIGDFRDQVTLVGSDGAEYLCELIGHCTPPLPQGPITIDNAGPASGTEIVFRNCFTQPCTWSFATDSALFRVVTPANNATLQVNAKTEAKCSVVFEPRDEEHLNVPGGVIPGKLFVTCTNRPEVPAWVYYLRGKVSVKTAAPAPAAGKKK